MTSNAPVRQRASASARYAEVALDLPAAPPFTYAIPSALRGRIAPGQRVWVPLRDRRAVGCVVALAARTPVRGVKPIAGLIDETPIVPPDLLALARWVAEQYVTSLGEALYAMLPAPLKHGRTHMTPREPWRPAPVPRTTPPALTTEQAAADRRIAEALEAGRHEIFLLHGITGSGKTEVYLAAIHRALQQGRSAIVLVPEIALTPQTIGWFTARFGPNQVAVLHSAMRDSHRLQEWQRIARGDARVVIGARSAVFAPVSRLGVIVVDEEHETTYKQDDAPRYHARDTAIERARQSRGVVILGSATPSLEAAYRARRGDYLRLSLTHRIDHQPLPRVEIVDLQRLARSRGPRILSPQLETALAQTLRDRQQAIIFLNRRGFATVVQCAGCGHLAACPACQSPMTFHQVSKQLICHHCQRRQPVPELCPTCRGRYVKFRGTGTERVESELARVFPTARIARMDTDTMRARGAHEAVLDRFRRGELDVLVGTQMVAKGHDFPQVTLIGVINADTALHLPDFRAGERTFALLTQVAGRAGRGELPGRVIVQTRLPRHEAIVAASRHDDDRFYRHEIIHRRALQLPPVAALAQITMRAAKEATARAGADMLAARLRAGGCPATALVGPSKPHVYRQRRQYHWQVIVKAPTRRTLLKRLAPVRALRRIGGAQVIVDVDPWQS